MGTRPPQTWGRLTFIVEEAAIHQDEPALVPLLDPGAGLWSMWRETDGGAVSRAWRSGGHERSTELILKTSRLWLQLGH